MNTYSVPSKSYRWEAMMAKITKKASKFLASMACTCPHSLLFSLIEKFGFVEEMVGLLPHDGSFTNLKRLITFNGEEDQIFCIISHFVGEGYYVAMKNSNMSIANEIPMDIRPALHQILPLGKEDMYENKGTKIKIKNLVEIGEHKGEGFWAAHLCGKVWVPYKKSMQADIKYEQALIDGFLPVLKGLQVVDVADYRGLYASTFESRAILSKYL